MSLNVAHQLPTKPSEPSPAVDIKRSKRQLAGGRKSKQQRDNIENAPSSSPLLSTATLANLPIQKQSTKIRKRLLTDNLPSPCTNDHLSTKRHKVLLDDPSTQNATSLHRTLSDKSSYLNQASSLDTNADRKDSPSKTQTTLVNWRKDSQLKHSGSESDDADDEDELSVVDAIRSASLDQTQSVISRASETGAESAQVTDGGPLLGLIDSAFGSSPTEGLPLRSRDDDPFGSDTTLTSPEDDSEDEPENDTFNVEVLTPQSSVLSQPEVVPEASSIPTPMQTATPSPAASPIKRRVGRPRKNPLPSPTSPTPRARLEKNGYENLVLPGSQSEQLSLSRKTQSNNFSQKEDPSRSLSLSPYNRQGSGSLMARIIDGKKQSGDNDAELSDSSDDTDLISFVKFSLKINSSDEDTKVPIGVVEEASVTTESTRECDKDAASNQPFLAGIQSSSKSEEYVFATPTLPIPRPIHATRSGGSRSTPLKLTLTHSASARRSSGKQNYPRSVLRSIPRPRLFQTCLDIMTQSEPSRHRPNVQSIKLMLKHALEQGMRKVKESSESCEQTLNKLPMLDTSSLQMQAWGCVVGNGKGLFPGSTRKQEEQQRVVERQTIVAEAYRSLSLPPPPENWDKSSKVLAAGLSLGSGSSLNAVNEMNAQRWSNVMDDALDNLSRRHGCEYCRKTYRNRNGLMYHMERCTMAQLQTSISADLDGDSTASETEDQRKARCPKSSRRDTSKFVGGETSNEEEEDEEGIIMCVCGSKEDEGAMVQCDECKVWLHIDCLDLTEEEIPEEYFCPPCMGQPTPSSGGKSFRHVPKSTKRKSEDRKVGRPRRRSRSEDSLSISSRLECSHESESDSDDADSDDDNEPSAEGLVSPQVVLNHNWEQDNGDPVRDLGYDGEFMSSVFGVQSARTIFRQSRAPALMLDGSSSQESQAELSNPLLSSDQDFDEENRVVFHAIGGSDLSSMGLELGSETDMPFQDSQTFDYLPSSSGSLFESEYGASDSGTPDQLLASEDTIDDSEGLRTPVDLQHGSDDINLWVAHDLEGFVEETAAEFDIDCSQNMMGDPKNPFNTGLNQYPVDWLNEDGTHHDDFDLDVLIDLEAVSLSDK
ncbi:myeloid lymphoid or mixed-lineage leukemia 5 (trithorax, ) [Entomortierella lignicola]|nr:myeloid lymphoid or mixed-lineage leukemia 5 (trithorax, ) [Entomortierella lignicola]